MNDNPTNKWNIITKTATGDVVVLEFVSKLSQISVKNENCLEISATCDCSTVKKAELDLEIEKLKFESLKENHRHAERMLELKLELQKIKNIAN